MLVGWEGAWPICVGFGFTCDVINGGLLLEMDLVFVFCIPDPVMSLMGGCYMNPYGNQLHHTAA